MAASAVRVKGLHELQRDFRKLSRDLSKEVRDELKQAAEPVADRAQDLALSEISHMTGRWSEMKVGATQKSVYVRPRARRRGGRPRPNFAPLMLERAMDPALEQRSADVVRALEGTLDRLAGRHGF
jgi:hypothetical protein